MRFSIQALTTLAFVGLAYSRSIGQPSILRRNDDCSKEPGSVEVCMGRIITSLPIITDNIDSTKCYCFTAEEAIGCLGDKKGLRYMGTYDGAVDSIHPAEGGHCLVYHSDVCADNTGMSLVNPENRPRKYPNKIIAPGVGRSDLPKGFTGIKCFPHMP